MSKTDRGKRPSLRRLKPTPMPCPPEAEDAAAPDTELVFCPVQAAACVMVRRALRADMTLKAAALAAAATVVVQVPGPDWVAPIAEAWRAEVLGVEDVPSDGDDDGDGLAPAPRDRWVEFRRDGSSRRDVPASGNGRVHHAVSEGIPVYGFSQDPDRLLPSDLMRVAERRVKLEPLDGAALHEALFVFCGRRPATTPEDATARRVTSADLLLSQRPGRDPDEMLRRVVSLALGHVGPEDSVPRLADLAGMDEAVAWGLSLKTDLADYRRGELAWTDVDRGVLLVGPPGTGKTTFAKALARECGVPLIVASIGMWQASKDGHLGHMLSAMRGTFDQARAAAPCILLLDEIDAVGDRRRFQGQNRDYNTQVVNALLELLDGAQPREGVVVVGATNHAEAVDPAIRRSGRLDRTIILGMPDATALAGILRHHLGDDLRGVDLSSVASRVTGATGADCERLVRSARRRARAEARAIAIADLEAEIPALPAEEMSAATRWTIAVHEAGHATAISVLRPGALLAARVAVRGPDMSIGGVEWLARPDGDRDRHLTRDDLMNRAVELLAGRAAEVVILGEPTAGAGGMPYSDIAQATWLLTALVASLGLGGTRRDPPGLWRGLPTIEATPGFLADNPDVSAKAAALMADAYARTLRLIEENRDATERVARLLNDRGTVTGAEVDSFVAQVRAERERHEHRSAAIPSGPHLATVIRLPIRRARPSHRHRNNSES